MLIRKRRAAALLSAALVFASAVLVVSGPPASAQLGLSCVSDTDVHYKPGLQFTPQSVNIKVDGALTPCVGDLSTSITAGSYGAHLHAVRSCADLLAPTTGEFTIEWNGGAFGFSTISFSRTATNVGGTIVTTEVGTVVAGDFAGYSTLFVTTGPHNPLECTTTPGVQHIHTNGNLTISPV